MKCFLHFTGKSITLSSGWVRWVVAMEEIKVLLTKCVIHFKNNEFELFLSRIKVIVRDRIERITKEARCGDDVSIGV